MKTYGTICAVLTLLVSVVGIQISPATADGAEISRTDRVKVEVMVSRAVKFLKDKAQSPDGSFSGHVGPGATAVVTLGLLQCGISPDESPVAESLAYLKGFVQKDGGIYNPEGFLNNYETCLAIQCFVEANTDGKYDDLIASATRYVKGEQWGVGIDVPTSDDAYGGAGYGKHQRPDMSNTGFFMEALKSAGIGPEDEAMKKALVFVSRCQNLETPHNTTKYASKNPDGGFYYTIAAGGESKSGETADGGLRSYGSMTYVGLKSFIYAGVDSDDPRVKGAIEWINKHYDLETNPGVGAQGLYYYYQVFAKALNVAGIDNVTDADGNVHNWRSEMIATLADAQREDGSWINTGSDRWLEGDPALVTGYVLMALSNCTGK